MVIGILQSHRRRVGLGWLLAFALLFAAIAPLAQSVRADLREGQIAAGLLCTADHRQASGHDSHRHCAFCAKQDFDQSPPPLAQLPVLRRVVALRVVPALAVVRAAGPRRFLGLPRAPPYLA